MTKVSLPLPGGIKMVELGGVTFNWGGEAVHLEAASVAFASIDVDRDPIKFLFDSVRDDPRDPVFKSSSDDGLYGPAGLKKSESVLRGHRTEGGAPESERCHGCPAVRPDCYRPHRSIGSSEPTQPLRAAPLWLPRTPVQTLKPQAGPPSRP